MDGPDEALEFELAIEIGLEDARLERPWRSEEELAAEILRRYEIRRKNWH